MKIFVLLFWVSCSTASSQAWTTFFDSSRAIDWTGAGFSIPNYSANCATQPTLTANSSGAASANTTALEAALASCDATHNVVNIPAGNYYLASWTFGTQGKQVVRGAGPNATTILLTATVPCSGLGLGPCMISNPYSYSGGSDVLPPSGNHQCEWTAGYTQGTTSITLNNCGGTPPVNSTILLDQANDTSDTGGIYVCNSFSTGCAIETNGSPIGRIISSIYHSQIQVAYVTAVSGSGAGPYNVTISPPGVQFNNIRSGQSPGAWWPGFVQNVGLENLTVDHSPTSGNTAIAMYDCYQCWVKNIRSVNAARDHVFLYQSKSGVIRDSYFYESQSHASESYGIEVNLSSDFLIENNIFQKVTNPLLFSQGSGFVVSYNFSLQEGFTNVNSQTSSMHNAGNGMNLWEGNNLFGIWSDIGWGSTSTNTYFRNMLRGWQDGKTAYTFPVSISSWNRGFNAVGNVLGQPSYHTTYESYATSSTVGTNGGNAANASVFVLGWSGNSSPAACTTPPVCDPLVRSTFMRWGNYDVANAAVRWDSTEASPGSVNYIGANFSSGYFGSLGHTLPNSLYYSSIPNWWPTGKAWPPVGPDVSSGNLGTCSGTYSGAQATASSQCTGGTLTSAWASHATSIPAQDCYLGTMGGPPDGSGSVLSFDANTCYAGAGISSGGPKKHGGPHSKK